MEHYPDHVGALNAMAASQPAYPAGEGEQEKVWRVLTETEKLLRALVRDKCRQAWGRDWQEKLCKRHETLAEWWLDKQARDRSTLDTYDLPSGTVLRYSTLGQLKQVILVEWQLFQDVFRFKKDRGRDNKKTLSECLEWAIEVRNRIAHGHPTHPHQLRRAWVACDEIRMQIAEWRGEPLWKRAPVEEQGAPGRPALRYFMTLEEYLTQRGPHFPKTSHFEEGLVHLPERHLTVMKRLLGEMGRCLLVGRSAAGKTVLAIALGKQFQETEGFEVLYGDAVRAQEGDGRVWYQAVCTNDRRGMLYLLDNCHLAPEEVSEFCFQWEGRPPRHAQAILISRPRAGESEAQLTELGNYFDVWSDVAVEVQPKEIYRGVIGQYAAAYLRRDPDLYVALEDDNDSLLEAQHSHNLMASTSRLGAWAEMGGRLSDVTQETVYNALARKYLSRASGSLAALCALWQYEIPAHNLFVDGELPEDEVDWLKNENLLTCLMVPGYGLLYQPAFHPEEAQEIFEASIYCKWGNVNASRVEAETVSSLRAYLGAEPPNYVQVYHRVHKEEQYTIQRQLLADRDLQACAVSQFERGRVSDTALYLRNLLYVEPSRSQELLREFVNALGIDGIWARMLEHTLRDISSSLRCIQKVDTQLAGDIVAGMDMKQLAQRIEASGRQEFSFMVGSLHSISPKHAKALLESVSMRTWNRFTGSINSAEKLGASLRRWGYSKAELKRFWQQFSDLDIATRLDRSPLGQVGGFIQHRYLYHKDGYALFKKRFLPRKLATESLGEIGKFIHRIGQVRPMGRALACEVLDLLVTVDLTEDQHEVLIAVLERSEVHGIQLLIYDVVNIDERYLPHIRQALYASDLTGKLAAADVRDLGYLLWNVFAHVDQSLAREYCKTVDKQQRSRQLSEASLDDLCRFLWNLTHISDLPRLQTLEDSIIEQRLADAWGSEIGPTLNLFGIVATTRPGICEDVSLPPIETQAQKECLAGWLAHALEELHPYTLALTLRGLRVHDELKAQELARQYLPIPEASQMLEEAKALALTPRSVTLLQETLEWLTDLASPVQPGKLSTLLNKAGLRPLPEIRSEVIHQLIEIVNPMDEPRTLVEVKSILTERVQVSKSKLQDILRAVVRGGCLLDEQGESVLSFTIPFSGLISSHASEIERKCMESYAQAVLVVDTSYFDDESNVIEFEQVTGGEMPDTGTTEQLRRKARLLRSGTG